MGARLPYGERDLACAEGRMAYDDVQKAIGRVANMFKLMAHHGRSFPFFVRWFPTLREGEPDLGLRRLAYARASQLNSAPPAEPSRAVRD